MNDARFTYIRRSFHSISAGLGGDYPCKIGLKGVPDNAFPQIVSGRLHSLGTNAQERQQFPIEQQQLVDNITKIRVATHCKFGVQKPGVPGITSLIFKPYRARSHSALCRPVFRETLLRVADWLRFCSAFRPAFPNCRRRSSIARAGILRASRRTTGA